MVHPRSVGLADERVAKEDRVVAGELTDLFVYSDGMMVIGAACGLASLVTTRSAAAKYQ